MSTIPPVPGTTPQDWIELVNIAINTQLPINVDLQALDITNTQQLIEYMQANNWEPVYRMSETIVGWAQVSGANPAETTAVAVRPAFDLITGAGGVATNLISGKGAVSLVSKAIVLSTCMALFVSSLTPLGTQEQEDYKQAILDAITPFTIDGENVPVFIDENGKTYLSEAILNGVREALVRLGTYAGEPDPDPITENVNITTYAQTTANPGTNTVVKDFFNELVAHGYIKDRLAKDIYNNNVRYITTSVRLRSGGVSTYVNAYYLFVYRYQNTILTAYVFSEDTFVSLYPNYANEQVTCVGASLEYADGTDAGSAGITATNVSIYVDPVTSKKIFIAYGINPSSTFVGSNPDLYSDIVAGSYNPTSLTVGPARFCNVAYYFMGDTASGVPGVDTTGKSDFGDLSKTLDDAIQGLADRAVELLNPTDEDMTNKDTWYPANLRDEDVFTDGLDETQTDPEYNTQGDPDTDSKDEIIDKLLQLIEDITGSPDLPDIPAGDSGNTPPAEPPVLNGSSNGLWTMYNPTKQQVNDFGAWLWSDTLIDQIIRQFNSPIDAVIGFHQIYCTPITGSQKIIKAGYLDSPVSAAEVTNQYVDIDCGQVSVNEYYQNALDYDNTQVSLFLPFVGIVPLNTNVVMGSTLHVIYRIDVFTGTCLAQVKVIKENSNAVMYAFEGNCAVQIPLTGTTYTGMVGALLGGLSATVSFMAGDMFHAGQGALSAIASAGTGLTGMKQSGNMGANAGALGIRIPYLIITRSASAMPAGFENMRGIPSTELVTLGSLSGFTSVRDVHLEGIPATAEELNEIKELLAEGVIL